MRILTYLIFGVSLMTMSTLAAQDELTIDTSLLIDDVVVYQNRLSLPISETARNIDVITKADIASMPVINIPELLQYAGGVDIRRRGVNGVQSDAGIRGGTFNQVQILINGVKMNDPQTGHHMMNLPVSLEDVERIEIIKGPAARIWGQNAFSGVINIITKITATDEIAVRVGLGLSSFETFNADVNVTIPGEHYEQSVTFSRIGSEGYRYNTDYGINTMYYQSQIKGVGANGIQLQAGYTDRKFGANGFYANEAFTEQYEEVTTTFVSATTLLTSGNITIRPRLSYRNNVDHYVFLRDNPAFFMNEHTGNTYNGELHVSHTNKLGVTGLGIDASRETLVSNNLGDRRRSIVGLFAEHRFLLMQDKLSITPGLYANKISDRELKIYPGIDLSYSVNRGTSIFATANWSDRIPTYTNLYYSSRTEQGNENLVAESATAIEVGIKRQSKTSSISLSLWHRDNRNLIDWAKDSLQQEKWVALNFNQVKMTGIDLNTKVLIADAIGQGRGLQVTADYTYINATIQDNDEIAVSRYALDNLRHQAILGLQAEVVPQYLYLNIHQRYLDRVSLEDYHLTDVKLSYRSSTFEGFFAINNLWDTIYRETNLVPMPGRWYGIGMRYKG